MAFRKMATRFCIKADTASVSYRRARAKPGKYSTGEPMLVISVKGDFLAAMELPQGARFWFALGGGPDAGKARVGIDRGTGGDGILVRAGRGSKRGGVFKFGFVPALGMDAAEVERVRVRRCEPTSTGDLFEIDCPPWLKAGEPDTPPAAPDAPKPAAAAAPARNGTRGRR